MIKLPLKMQLALAMYYFHCERQYKVSWVTPTGGKPMLAVQQREGQKWDKDADLKAISEARAGTAFVGYEAIAGTFWFYRKAKGKVKTYKVNEETFPNLEFVKPDAKFP